MASLPTEPSHLQTDTLEIAYLDIGKAADVVLLLHGWPDDPTTWLTVAERLTFAGYRVIIPWLRGFGATCFLSAETFRDRSAETLAQDATDLMDGLEIQRFAVAGHDWGARRTAPPWTRCR